MAIKMPIFNKIEPLKVKQINANLKNVLSSVTIESILSEIYKKMKHGEILDSQEVILVLDWLHNLDSTGAAIVHSYFEENILKSSILDVVAEYFRELKQLPVLKFALNLKLIQSRITKQQSESFDYFLSSNSVTEKNGNSIIDYVENLNLVPNVHFSNGQREVGAKFILSADFSSSFETSFDRLVQFARKSGVTDDMILLKFLDRQLLNLIKSNESTVTAKAFRPELGFTKYKKLLESIIKQPSHRNLPGYLHLIRLVSKFEEAVQILSGHEEVRGTYWKSVIQKVDGVTMKSSSGSKYKIAVAFYVRNFVFCDFGPTGNKIHIYDRDTFLKQIERRDSWQIDEFLTNALPENKYSHISGWQEKTTKLIETARNTYG